MNPICPYCRAEVAEPDNRIDCPGCATPHHQDCFDENGGCTVFGCSKAPVDEPKITVTSPELTEPSRSYVIFPTTGDSNSAAAVAAALSAAQGQSVSSEPPAPPPPPPPPGGTGAPPPPMPYARPTYAPLTPAEIYNSAPPRKNRITFILLGVFLGAFGVHNFYAGYVRRAVGQLCTTVLTCFYGAVVSWIWAIVEICIVKQDSDGVQFS